LKSWIKFTNLANEDRNAVNEERRMDMGRAEGRPISLGTQLEKSPTGIKGLDEVTKGGLPKGRPTLVCGGAGSGKTLLAAEFLVRGALQFGEPGVFMSFEETSDELTKNVVSLGFKLDDLVARKKISLDYVQINRSEIEETGEYDLEGLFIRLEHAIASVRAKRVVLDTIETLFSGIPNPAVVRAELRRLFQWLKNKGMTTIITGEQGEKTFTRHGLEEYVSDCVIFLDHRISEQVSTRRIRVVKYRGSAHDTNEFPFLIDEKGITVMPITSLGLRHTVTNGRVSTGIPRLDAMLGGKGYYRGSSVLISGSAGTGKTSLVAHFTDAACRRGERCLYFAFEESESQVIRNMLSIGIDLGQWVKKGLLKYHADRPTVYGLETHLSVMQNMINEFKPAAVIVDPVSNLNAVANISNVKTMLTRLLDQLKLDRVTTVLTILTQGSPTPESTDVDISSLADTWIRLRDIEFSGERNRGIYILKSRGMAHSNQIREFVLTDKGVNLLDVYVGPSGVLTGSARLSREAQEKAKDLLRQQDTQIKQLHLERKRKAMEAQIADIRAEFKTEEAEVKKSIKQEKLRQQKVSQDREAMAEIRKAD
jgi:circadian clock protein KaiC